MEDFKEEINMEKIKSNFYLKGEPSEEETLTLYKDEKRGIYTLMVFYFISWGLLFTPWWVMNLIGAVSLGLIGFSLWRVLDGLLERKNEFSEDKRKGRKNKNG